MKIPFDIKYRPQIESGEYKVETRSGETVRVVCWDRIGTQLIVLVGKDENVLTYNLNGTTGQQMQLPSDLFIIAPEEEKSEFEKAVTTVLIGFQFILRDKDGILNIHDTDEFIKEKANMLLIKAREQFIKDGYVIEKKTFHDAVEGVNLEVKNEVSANIGQLSEFEFALRNALADTSVLTEGKDDEEQSEIADKQAKRYAAELLAIAKEECKNQIENDYREIIYGAYEKGKAEALKNLPRWRHAFTTCSPIKGRPKNPEHAYYSPDDNAFIVLPENSNEAKCLMLDDLKKLPGFKED